MGSNGCGRGRSESSRCSLDRLVLHSAMRPRRIARMIMTDVAAGELEHCEPRDAAAGCASFALKGRTTGLLCTSHEEASITSDRLKAHSRQPSILPI
jgi:predicted RNA methylase